MHDFTRIVKVIYMIDVKLESCKNSLSALEESQKKYLSQSQAPEVEKEQWVTARAAGELINVNRKTIEAYYGAGKIRRDTINGLYHYLVSDVMKYDKRTEAQKRK